MRTYFYCLAAICSALIGWNIGQVVLSDLDQLTTIPEVVLFPCLAASLAVGIVTNEIFISNPTRPKLNLRILKGCILIALGLGLGIGLIAGGLVQILFNPSFDISSTIIRVLGWLVIGIAVGLAEGISWRWRSVEAGNRSRFRKRVITSLLGASIASILAALLFEGLRSQIGEMSNWMKDIEDPVGFSILGLLLGLTFSQTNSPSYLAALRAGGGFERRKAANSVDAKWARENSVIVYPCIKRTSKLEFVSRGKDAVQSRDEVSIQTRLSEEKGDLIEEGLSIQLPNSGTIKIGSAPMIPDIHLPGVPLHAADVEIYPRHVILDPTPRAYRTIEVNGYFLKSEERIKLKHNSVITFHTTDNKKTHAKKLYRMVYYNRFLDPQS